MTDTRIDFLTAALPNAVLFPLGLALFTTMFIGVTLGIHNSSQTADFPDTRPEPISSTPDVPLDTLPSFDNPFWLTVLLLVISNAELITRLVVDVTGIISLGGPLNYSAMVDLHSILGMLYIFHQVVFEYISMHVDFLEVRNLPFIDTARIAVARWMGTGSALLILYRLIERILRIRPEHSIIPRQDYEDYW